MIDFNSCVTHEYKYQMRLSHQSYSGCCPVKMSNMAFKEPTQHAGNGVNHSISKFYYSKGFPVEVWYYLGGWIKNRFSRSNLSPSNPKDAEEIKAIYSEVLTEVHTTKNTSNDPFANYKLWCAEQKLEKMSPSVFYQILKEGIELERTLTFAAQSGTQVIVYSHITSTMAAEAVDTLANKSLEFRHRTAQLASLLAQFKFSVDAKANNDRVAREMYSHATATNIEVSAPKKRKHQFTTIIDTLEQQMESMKNQLESCLPEYLTYMRETVSECHLLVGKVVDKLLPTIRWHCWELNDNVPSMTDVQQWYSQLIDICFDLKESLGTMEHKDIPSNFQSLWYDRINRSSKELTDCRNSLLANPIAVSTQPAEILRKYKQTSMQVGFLCAKTSFIRREAKLEMKVILINENQAKKVHQFGFPNGIQKDKVSGNGEMYETSGTLTGNTAALSSAGTWEFERLSIKTVERKKMTNNDSVLDEKYCFLIYNMTPLENNKIWWCCSRPFFVTVNNSQNSKVFASVFIDEYFRTRNREPFDVPEMVPCSRLISALEKYFMRMTNSQRGFTPTNKTFLRSKLLKRETHEDPLVDLKRLSENVELCNFTFFNWFTGIIELVNAHLKSYWENGYIIGFIDRLTTKELLKNVSRDGGFIVRFSESKLSSIILSYSLKMDDEGPITASLEPLTCDTLKSLSLPEILKGRIHHGPAKRDFIGVYFNQMSEGYEVLKWEEKSKAFPPSPDKEKAESPNPVRCVMCNVVLGVANPEDA